MDIQQVNGVWVPSNDIHLQDWLAGKPFTQNRCLNEFLKHCKDNSIKFNTVVDIGAWCGTWSLAVGSLAKNIVAFEPDPIHYHCLEKNKISNITCYNVALGETEKQVGLSIDNFTQAKYITEIGYVQMQTLDSYNFTDVDLIKIDVEGYEMSVLKGCERTLEQCKYLMIELNNNSKRFKSNNAIIERWLSDKGFSSIIKVWPDVVYQKK